jgi:hypothetical protein
MNSNALDAVQKLGLAFGFPLFYGRHSFGASRDNKEMDDILRSIAGDKEKSRQKSPYCRRRYSGDMSKEFPRSRYYHAVPSDIRDQTIVCELNAYTIPALVGFTCAELGSEDDVVNLVFRGLPRESNPLFRGLANPEFYDHVFKKLPKTDPLREAAADERLKGCIPDVNTFVIPVQLSTTHHDIANCLDLRRPEARCWLVNFFHDPPPGLYGDAFRALALAHRFEFQKVQDWAGIIGVIYAQTMGGNPLTDMIGTYLRSVGCDALIFPSARSDTLAHWVNGELKSFVGWNLVDYRGAGEPEKVGIDIGDPIESLPGKYRFSEPTSGPDRGSLIFRGPSLVNRMINQLQYEEYLRAFGPAWQVKHGESEFFERGYFWYAKRYSNQDDRFAAICVSCKARFDDPEVEIMEQCPHCNGATESQVSRPEKKIGAEPDPASVMPRQFVVSVGQTIVAMMNQPDYREAIDAIDPNASNAFELYGRIFNRAIPSLPPLSASQIQIIARELGASTWLDNNQPLDVAENEVFSFFSRILGQRTKKRG